MTDTTVAPQKPRAPRWMWILLVVSVALNLIVIGMGIGAIVKFRMHYGGPGAGFARFVKTLPDTRQRELKPLIDEREAIRPLREAAWRARHDARKAFAAEPFDEQKLRQAYLEASAARQALNDARGAWFVKMSMALSSDERSSYLKWRRRHHRPFRHHWRDRSE